MKPIIGVIGRPDMASDDDKVVCIWEGTRRAIVKKQGIPFMILPNQDVEYETLRPKDTPRLTCDEKEDLKQSMNVSGFEVSEDYLNRIDVRYKPQYEKIEVYLNETEES